MNKNLIILFSIVTVLLLLFTLTDPENIQSDGSITKDVSRNDTDITETVKIDYKKSKASDKVVINSELNKTTLLPPVDPKIIFRTTSSNGKYKISLENPDLIGYDKNKKRIPVIMQIDNFRTKLSIPNELLKRSDNIILKITDLENNITHNSPAYFLDEMSNNAELDQFIKIDPNDIENITYSSKENNFN